MSIKTLYHGQKGFNGTNEINSFVFNPFIYLTDHLEYAKTYGKSGGVYEVQVDSKTLLDCSSLGGDAIYFVMVQNFLKGKGVFVPVEWKQMFYGHRPEYAFWQMIRIAGNRIKDRLVAKGYNGLIMNEKALGRYFSAYVLFNENPILKIEKYKSLTEKVLKEVTKTLNLEDFVNSVKILQGEFESKGFESTIAFRQFQSIHINKIFSNESGKGYGNEFLEQLTDLCDQYGIICTLSPTDEYGMNLTRLKKFYNKFGFKDNKGKNADSRFWGGMIRLPRNN